jgi:N-acetylglucosaminyldiphosphoundecaprenol N-acetyl-beta-D-mannosaminyltransferase
VSVSQVERKRIRVLDVPIDCVTFAEAIDRLDEFVQEGSQHLVVTADASGIAQSQNDPVLKEIYESADLVTPDSQGVLWALNRKGVCLAGRVSGVELVDRICALSAARRYRIFFLGAEPGVAELAADRMRQKYPGCNIVGARHGYFKPEQDDEVASEVGASQPDFLFVAMGIPRQEKFIRETGHLSGAKVGMGVGGTFDVFSGKVRRAPSIFQRLRLEWLWRVMSNPKKIGKVMMLPKFAWAVLREPR